MEKLINFDNNATTKVSDAVLARMNEVYGFAYNSSATHTLGRHAGMIVEAARQDLLDAVNGGNYELYFTSGGTEANNMAIFGDDYEVIIMSKIEHSAVYNARPGGAEIIEIGVDENCVLDVAGLKKALEKCRGKNFLVSIMYANAETGVIQPLKEVTKLVHQAGGLIHSDLVQAFGKISVDLEDLNVDFASVSAHKVSGPQGVGGLFVRRGLEVRPLIYGGGQEFGKRSGTMNVAGVAGFGVAGCFIGEKVAKMAEIRALRDFIEGELAKKVGKDIRFFGEKAERVGNTSYMALRGADSQTQLIHFDLNGIMVSAGSACSSGSARPSRVLTAMGVEEEFLRAVRVSLCAENTKEEAERFVEVFFEFWERLGL